MSHKVHPFVFRLGGITNWKSRWLDRKKYRELLKQDVKLRDFINEKLGKAGIASVEIERSANSISIIVKTARPGLVIGRGGAGIEDLKEALRRIIIKDGLYFAKTRIDLQIEEIRQIESQAAIVAFDMAAQTEKRMPFRRIMKQTLEKIMQNKEVEGAKVMMGGRLNGAEIARTEWLKKGRIPLQTLRANVDYAQATAYTTYGTVGVKVWIYKGESFN